MDIKKLLVESVVERYIREIATDPRRGIRKLVDLGRQNTKGGFRDKFLQYSREMLRDESSPYYALGYNAITRLDHGVLKTMSVNMGYNCWTKGAAQLRGSQKERGITLPWNVTFHFDRTSGESSLSWCRSLVAQGQRLGIYSYSVFLSEDFAQEAALEQLLKQNAECAFFIFLPSGASAETAEAVSRTDNAFVLVDTGHGGAEAALSRLSRTGRLFGVYRFYETSRDVEELCADRWLEPVEGMPCLCAISVARPETDAALRRQVCEYKEAFRAKPRAPMVAADYDSDFAAIGTIIVERPVFLSVNADGTLDLRGEMGPSPMGKSIRELAPDQLLAQGI